MYWLQSLIDIDEEPMVKVFQVFHEVSISHENESILSNLEEGIAVLNDDQISYQNQVLKSIVNRLKTNKPSLVDNLVDLDMFKLVK